MEQHEAGCLCGAVRMVTEGPPIRVGVCHCLECRKHHGAAFYAAAIFPTEAVTVSGKTGSWKGRHFCPVCGSSVYATAEGEIEVPLGAYDKPGVFAPEYELWTIRREPWLPVFPGVPGFARNRE
ncbi:hypothetical protein LA6_005536 (plasmid) [Paracoccaceae bacterium]|nr:hypothetical protein LA6_005536 [Paracoccaceae bacterium]